ncbi:hypothetical protein VNO77_40775 [Canavalia gladiata]|uniref:Uncharacterized protein n=1 Tax=Canavalia gladiata TaxID=3824 RepID=A0AAN9PRA2_CANGL
MRKRQCVTVCACLGGKLDEANMDTYLFWFWVWEGVVESHLWDRKSELSKEVNEFESMKSHVKNRMAYGDFDKRG